MHQDYSPGNILVKKEKDGYTFKIIDLNRMKFTVPTTEQRLLAFSKLWASENDLAIIIKEYANLLGISSEQAIQTAQKASQKHKDKKNLKKRLKGIPVVD